MKRIVVYPGSFNPVTKAHFEVLSKTVERFDAEEGLFVLTPWSALNLKCRTKQHQSFILPKEKREEMVRSLTQYEPKLRFWGYEVGGASPNSGETILKIAAEYKDYEIYYVCGADKVKSLPHWRNFEPILSSIKFVVYERGSADLEKIIDGDPILSKYRSSFLIFPPVSDEGISSTKVRERFFKGEDYSSLLMPSVATLLSSFSPSDFPSFSFEEEVKNYMMGGSFGRLAARKYVYKTNLELFKDWDPSLLGDKERLLDGTKVYEKEFHVEKGAAFPTVFEVKNADVVDVAKGMKEEGFDPAIVSSASSLNPGGGSRDGKYGGEEDLCYRSTLSCSLLQFGNAKKKCVSESGFFKETKYPLDLNFGGIYSLCVAFFRKGEKEYFSLLPEPFSCSVISVPSLSREGSAHFIEGYGAYFGKDGILNEAGVEIQKSKIRVILRIAIENGHDSLVFGAYGVEADLLSCEQSARLLGEVFEEAEFKHRFRKIVFALPERKSRTNPLIGREGKYKPFYNLSTKEAY